MLNDEEIIKEWNSFLSKQDSQTQQKLLQSLKEVRPRQVPIYQRHILIKDSEKERPPQKLQISLNQLSLTTKSHSFVPKKETSDAFHNFIPSSGVPLSHQVQSGFNFQTSLPQSLNQENFSHLKSTPTTVNAHQSRGLPDSTGKTLSLQNKSGTLEGKKAQESSKKDRNSGPKQGKDLHSNQDHQSRTPGQKRKSIEKEKDEVKALARRNLKLLVKEIINHEKKEFSKKGKGEGLQKQTPTQKKNSLLN